MYLSNSRSARGIASLPSSLTVAAYMALVELLEAAGCCRKEWVSEMWRSRRN